jgi:hypothetical protein
LMFGLSLLAHGFRDALGSPKHSKYPSTLPTSTHVCLLNN